MDIRKYILVCLGILFLVGCSPAWADPTEVTESVLPEQATEVVEVVEETGVSLTDEDIENISNNVVNDMLLAGSDGALFASTYSTEQDSEMTCDMKLVTSDGAEFFIPSEFMGYEYVYARKYGSVYTLYATSNLGISASGWTGTSVANWYVTHTDGFLSVVLSDDIGFGDKVTVKVADTKNILHNSASLASYFHANYIKYSNRDIDVSYYDETNDRTYTYSTTASGSVSDVYFNINFDTGIEDYTLPVITFKAVDGFTGVLPEFSYDGYIFEGWYMDINYTTPYTSEIELLSDVTLFAKTKEIYDITFVNGFYEVVWDSTTDIELVFPDTNIAGWVFLGWYLDSELTEPYTSDYVFTSDTTLYAKYEEAKTIGSIFNDSVFNSLSALFEVDAIKYILSLIGLVIIIGIIKMFVTTRI